MASSRVGTRTSPRGCRLGGPDQPASLMIMGRPNAKVLPDPVRPRPSTSRPASASGIVAAWIGNGSSMPAARRVATRFAETPKSANPRDAASRVEKCRGAGDAIICEDWPSRWLGARPGAVRSAADQRFLGARSVLEGLAGMTSQFSPRCGRLSRHVERPDLDKSWWEGRTSLRLTSSRDAGGPDADSNRRR